MHFSALTAVGLAAVASAKTISVTAGEKGFSFSPANFTAAKGDLVEVTFFPLNHSIAQGDPSTPCLPSKGGFWSGFLPASTGPADQIFRFQVNSTDPIYFYCAQKTGSHCASGMVGVINPPSASALDDYKAASAKAKDTQNPPHVWGGVLVSAASASAGASSGSGSSDNSSSVATGGSNNVSGGNSTSGNSTSASKPNDASSFGSFGGVAAAAVGMAIALVMI